MLANRVHREMAGAFFLLTLDLYFAVNAVKCSVIVGIDDHNVADVEFANIDLVTSALCHIVLSAAF